MCMNFVSLVITYHFSSIFLDSSFSSSFMLFSFSISLLNSTMSSANLKWLERTVSMFQFNCLKTFSSVNVNSFGEMVSRCRTSWFRYSLFRYIEFQLIPFKFSKTDSKRVSNNFEEFVSPQRPMEFFCVLLESDTSCSDLVYTVSHNTAKATVVLCYSPIEKPSICFAHLMFAIRWLSLYITY